MKNNKQRGVSFVEFSLIAIIFFTVIFATIALGVDAYRRFVAGEQAEEVLKKVENTASLLSGEIADLPAVAFCNLKDNNQEEITEETQDTKDKIFCGFQIYESATCEEALEKSVEENCYGDAICKFWFNLYKIAKEYEKENAAGGGYLYGKVYGGQDSNGTECYSSFAILLPGFLTGEISEKSFKNGSSAPKVNISADGNNNISVMQRIKKHEVTGTKKYVPSLFDKILRRGNRGSEVSHYGYIRTGGRRIESDITTEGNDTPTREIPTATPTNFIPTITPTNTPTLKPGEPTPTDTPTETPTPTPTATLDCGYYKVDVSQRGAYTGNYNDNSIENLFKNAEGKLDCFDKMIEQAKYTGQYYWTCQKYTYDKERKVNVCTGGWKQGGKISDYSVYKDDAALVDLLDAFGKLGTAGGCEKKDLHTTVHVRSDLDYSRDEGASYKSFCKNFSFYIDKDCNVLSDIEGKTSCGDLTLSYIQSCPISLVFNDKEDISTNMTITRFNLDLEKSKDTWALWKASEKFPLLVYDAEHTGQIKDASQLFGNWTFGGKHNDGKIPWRNGYEALGLLDKNYDGVLTDEELEPLALWFDENRNAISEEGEVKSLKELNITKIHFTNYEQSAVSRDLVANVGYERIVDGKTITGKSIDWWTTVSDKKTDVVRSLIKEGEANGNKFTIKDTKENEDKIVEVQKDDPSFGGLWDYYLEFDEAKGKTYRDGLFAIFEKQDTNEIIGYTFSERQLRGLQYDKAIFASYIEGIRTKEGGNYIIKFESEYNGSRLKSKATLSSKNRILLGETEVYDIEGKKVATYPWVAKKKKEN